MNNTGFIPLINLLTILSKNESSGYIVFPLLIFIIIILYRHRSRLFEKLEKIIIMPILEDGVDEQKQLIIDSGDFIPCPIVSSITTVT